MTPIKRSIEIARPPEAVFAYLEGLGHGSMLDGVIAGIEEGWFQGEIAESAYAFQRKLRDGRWILVGVNGFTEGDDGSTSTLYIDDEVEEKQLKRLAEVKQARSDEVVASALDRLRADAAQPELNLMPALLDAANAYVTVGEAMGALESVFGTWVERPQV